ncbi:hypothetical protein V6Z12_A06G096500 [Gossypium hirsutum]
MAADISSNNKNVSSLCRRLLSVLFTENANRSGATVTLAGASSSPSFTIFSSMSSAFAKNPSFMVVFFVVDKPEAALNPHAPNPPRKQYKPLTHHLTPSIIHPPPQKKEKKLRPLRNPRKFSKKKEEEDFESSIF